MANNSNYSGKSYENLVGCNAFEFDADEDERRSNTQRQLSALNQSQGSAQQQEVLERLNYKESVLEKSDYFDKRSDEQQLQSVNAVKDSLSQGGESDQNRNQSEGVSPSIYSQIDSVHTEPMQKH